MGLWKVGCECGSRLNKAGFVVNNFDPLTSFINSCLEPFETGIYLYIYGFSVR